MLSTLTASLVATTIFLSTATAAPTRAHCRCTLVSDAAPEASTTHWTPAQNPATSDFCSNLGPELEHFQHAEPDLYETYLGRTEHSSNNNNQQFPLTASKVLINFVAPRNPDRTIGKEPRPTTRPRQRVVCHAENDAFTEYQGSFVTLCVLHIIVGIAIIACIAEVVHLSLAWYGGRRAADFWNWKSVVSRLRGEGKIVLEVSSLGTEPSEKSGRTPAVIVEAPNGDRICINYEEDDDDEMNRPVM